MPVLDQPDDHRRCKIGRLAVKFRSTRGDKRVTLDEALIRGIAEDGGLYLPDELPTFSIEDFSEAQSIDEVAQILLRPFFESSALLSELDEIIAETFSFPIPVTALPVQQGSAGLLELYHGPTAAFKDVGAAFLAACMSRLEGDVDNPLTVLVATSGDTGGAVAAARAARHARRRSISGRQGLRSAGTSADLLGRQHIVAGCAGILRRLPGDDEVGYGRCGAGRKIPLQFCKQHQHRQIVAAKHLLR
jgi:hypothetical protein